MKKIIPALRTYWPILVFIAVYFFIFRNVFFHKLVPFPGDLLASWFFPYSAGGWVGYSPWITHKEFILADVIRQIYPWRILAIDLMKQGSLPLWNIYSFSGNPLLGNMQSAVFYPLNILFFLMNERLAWIAYIMIQPVLATWFMYLFIRSLKMSKLAAIFSGITFAFIGYTTVWFEMGTIGHAALWLPFILWGITKFFDTKKTVFLTLSAIGIGFSILAGHTQTTAYVMLFAYAYFLAFGWNKITKRALVTGLIILSLGILLAGVQVLPTYELMNLSPRDIASSFRPFHQFIIPYSHIAMLFAPDFFGNPATNNFWGINYGEFMSYFGVVALIVGSIGFFTNIKNKLVRLCLIFSVIAFLIAFVPFVADFLFFLQIPVLSTALPSRTIFLIGVSFAIVSAFGIEELRKEKSKKIFIPMGIILAVYIILWGVTFLPQFDHTKASVTHRNLLLPTAIAFVTCFLLIFKKYSMRYNILWIVLFICMAIEYSYFLNKYLPMAPMRYMFPQQDLVTKLQQISKNDRVYGYDTATIQTNLTVQWHVQTPEGYDALYIKHYSELMRAATTGKLETDLPRSDALLPQSLPTKDSYAKQELMNLLDVRYVLDKDDTAPKIWSPETYKFPTNRFVMIYQHFKWKIFQNKQALPHAAIFYNYKVIPQDATAIQTLFDQKFPYRQALILAKAPKTVIKTSSSPITPANITSYKANSVSISTNTKQPGILFLSDNYYPGWTATVDNKIVPILRADYSFRGVEVPAGKHMVVFRYQPMSFYLGALISGISFLILLFVAKSRKIKRFMQ